MALYEYQCLVCEEVFEALSRPGDPNGTCPHCGSRAKRLYSSFSIKVHPSFNEAQEIVHERYRKGEIA